MKKRVISWLLTVVMVVSLLPTSVLADMLAADQEQQTQQEQIAPVDTENTVPAGNEESRSSRSLLRKCLCPGLPAAAARTVRRQPSTMRMASRIWSPAAAIR